MSDHLARDVARKGLWVRIGILAGIFTGLLVVGLLVSLLVSIRSTQIDGTPTGQRLLKSSDLIVSCTSPKGKCSKANAAKTKLILQAVADNNLYTISCGIKLITTQPSFTLDDLRSCVTKLALSDKKAP